MKQPLKIGVLASTKGTSMQVLIDAIACGALNAEIVAVISDKKDAYALERAEKHHIPAIFISPKDRTREEFDKLVMQELNEREVDLIHLIGYMRILSAKFVKLNAHKTMNVHPALLPQAPGTMDLNTHQIMLDRGARVSGDTIMFIDEGADTGPIIWQEPVPIMFDEKPETLKARVQETEQGLIILATRLFMENKLEIEGAKVKILGMTWKEVHEKFLKTMEEIKNYKSAN